MLLYMANDSLRRRRVTIDTAAQSLTMHGGGTVTGTLRYTSSAGAISLEGTVAGDSLHVDLRRTDPTTLPLLRRFQWVVGQ